MDNKFIGLMVGLTVGVLMVSGFLWPVVSDATSTETKFVNEGYLRYTSIESDSAEEITVFWDHTDPKNIVVGENTLNLSTMNNWTSIVFGDDWAIRYVTSADAVGTTIQYIGPTNSAYMGASDTDTVDLTITLSAGTMSISNGTTTQTAAYTTAYYPDPNGTMTMKRSNESVYMLKDSSIIEANGTTNVAGVGVGVHFKGTIEDGYDFTLYRNTNSTEVSNVVSNYEAVSGYENLVSLASITFDMTPAGENATQATYSYFLVPYEVTAEKSWHLDTMQIAMIGVIGTLGAIVLIAAAAGSIRRLD